MKAKSLILFLLLTFALSVAVVAAEEDNADAPIRVGTSYAALANVYHGVDGYSVWRYVPEMEQGQFAFFVSHDEIDAIREQIDDGTLVVSDDLLLGEQDDIALWYQSDNTCRIDSPTVDGAEYSYSFEC